MTSSRNAGAQPVGRPVVVTAVAGTVFIAAAFWLSFTALADLAIHSGIEPSQAWAWPLIVDGIIVVANVSVVALSRYGARATWHPWALLTAGSMVSVTANSLHATLAADIEIPGLLAAAVAAVPPLLLAITHLTVILTRVTPPPTSPIPAEEPIRGSPDMVPPPAVVDPVRPVPVDVGRASERAEASRQRAQGFSNKTIARRFVVHPSTVGRWFAAADTAGNSGQARSVGNTVVEKELTR